MKVAFLSGIRFNRFELLSRAIAVVIQDNLGENKFELFSIGNPVLRDLLVSYSDSTRAYLRDQGIETSAFMEKDTKVSALKFDTVVTLGELTYYPHKAFVNSARAAGMTVLEYK